MSCQTSVLVGLDPFGVVYKRVGANFSNFLVKSGGREGVPPYYRGVLYSTPPPPTPFPMVAPLKIRGAFDGLGRPFC